MGNPGEASGIKVTILGCGLIGGSIALALRRRRPEWTVVCLDLADRLPAIIEAGVAAETGTLEDIGKHLPESSIVLLAMPVQAMLETLASSRAFLRPGTVVSDVASTKKQVMAQARALLPPGIHFIGGHPMAGSERSGVEAADPLLFSDRVYVLCPYPDTPPDALLLMMDLVESLPARPITMDPEEHDRIMAMISHLPQLIAVALMHAALAADATHSMLDTLAGRGFLDMTRLAASDFGVWRGILETNQEAIRESHVRFAASLAELCAAMGSGDAAPAWEQAAGRRRKMGADSRARMQKLDFRTLIDGYDQRILAVIAQRMQVAARIGKLKKRQEAPVFDAERERRMMLKRREWGDSLDLPADLIDELFAVILKHSSRLQAGT